MRGDQRGATSVELVILIPAIMIMVALVVASGRVWFARAQLTDAAYAAARAASLSRSATVAQDRAEGTFAHAMATAGLTCENRRLRVDTSGFAVPAGYPATVRVTARCEVPLSDLMLPGASASIALQAHADSPLDSYRERR